MKITTTIATSTFSDSLWLVLDQGGHASRAMVFDQQGQQITQAYADISTQYLGSDRVEHNPKEIVESLQHVIHEVAHSLGKDSSRVRAAGLATQRSSIVCWHKQNGQALSSVLSWQDRRNLALVNELMPHQAKIQQLTGLVLSAHYGASKIRWCLDHLSEVRSALRENNLYCGPLASYLLYSLLNEQPYVVDPANASRTQLWSPLSSNWSLPLLHYFGIPSGLLPQSVPTHFNYGLMPFADRTIPLRVCTGDQAVAPFANGSLQDHTLYINLGTGAFILAPLSQSIEHAAPLLRSVLCSDEHKTIYALEGTVNGAGSALSWWQERTDMELWPILNSFNRSDVSSRSIPLFINAVGGIASPFWLPSNQSRFIDAANSNAHEHLYAIVESIAFLINANIELMRTHLPFTRRIVVGGGLSACHYLNECIADLTQLPVEVLSEHELTAKGLAYLTAGEPPNWQDHGNTTLIRPTSNIPLKSRETSWLDHIKR